MYSLVLIDWLGMIVALQASKCNMFELFSYVLLECRISDALVFEVKRGNEILGYQYNPSTCAP